MREVGRLLTHSVKKRIGVSFEAFRRIAVSFPGVEEGTSYGTPAFRVQGKFLARLREDNETLAIKCGFEERDFRMQAAPNTFFTTDHYRGYPTVLVRLAAVSAVDVRDVFEQAWRRNAGKRLIASYRAASSAVKQP